MRGGGKSGGGGSTYLVGGHDEESLVEHGRSGRGGGGVGGGGRFAIAEERTNVVGTVGHDADEQQGTGQKIPHDGEIKDEGVVVQHWAQHLRGEIGLLVVVVAVVACVVAVVACVVDRWLFLTTTRLKTAMLGLVSVVHLSFFQYFSIINCASSSTACLSFVITNTS